MIKYRFECCFLTPAFVNSASEAYLEVTPTGVKGGIMFWWRALYGPKDTKELKRKSFDRFGGAFKEGKAKEANMKKGALTVRCPKSVPVEKYHKDLPSSLNYMAYGEYDTQTKSTSGYLSPNKKFTVLLQVEDETHAEEFIIAFYLLSYFGGLGAKSRNGFGQFEVNEVRKTVNGNEVTFEWPDVFKEIRRKVKDEECGYHERFHKKYSFWKTKLFPEPKEAHVKLIKTYKSIKEVYNKPKNKIVFSPDHKRVFTAPYNNKENKYKGGYLERFTKSYFFAINKVKDKYQGQILFLPIHFHQLSLSEKDLKTVKYEEKPPKQPPIDFLDFKYYDATQVFNKELSKYLNKVEL